MKATRLEDVKLIRSILNDNDEALRNSIGKPYTVFMLELLRYEMTLFIEQKKLQPELPFDCNNKKL